MYTPQEGSPSSDPRTVRAFRRWLVVFLALLVLLIFSTSLLQTYTDWLWFVHDAKQPEVFRKTIMTKLALWWSGAAFAFLVVYLNSRAAITFQSVYEGSPATEQARSASAILDALQKFGRLLALGVATAVALGVGSSLSGATKGFWLFQSSVQVGHKDPLFGMDLGFFMFKLPWLTTLASRVSAVLLVALILSMAAYLGTGALAKIARIQLAQGPRRVHLSLLGGFALIAVGAQTYLSKYMILLQNNLQFVGPGYALNQTVKFYGLVGAMSAVLGVIVMLNAWVWKPWRVAMYGLPLLALGWLVLLGFVPGFIQRYRVEPNLLAYEKPFAARAIEATRFAYGLDKFEVHDFAVSAEPTREEVGNARETLDAMRLWDPSVLGRVYDERQSLRPYYRFYDVDVDRYTIDNQQRMVMLAPRDINYDGVAPNSQNWQNQHLRYTHGFGVVVTPANVALAPGQPQYWLANFPPQQGSVFKMDQQRIYFAHYPQQSKERNSYVILNTRQSEFDYPGETDQTHTWKGTRGVPVSGALAKFAYSTLWGEIKFYMTGDLTKESRVVYRRDILDRARQVYPFLKFDQDPYIVLDQRRVVWIIDAYTTSGMVPYSDFSYLDGSVVNYVRNSVKIVIDAYSGDMTAYAMEPDEPILKAWMKVFPGLLVPFEKASPTVKQHVRYPEDMFAVQSEVMAQYHVTDPTKFLSNEDAWQVPMEIGRGGIQEPIAPYYVQMSLPGTKKEGFVLIRPFSPRTKNNMIGWMAAHCDSEDYGKVVLYRFPRDTQTQGPLQIEASFAADPIVADINRQFNNDQSSIVPGNLLVIPIGSSILYVKPLFLESKSRPIPELRKVILGLQNRVVVGDSYEEALALLFGVRKTGAIPDLNDDNVQNGRQTAPVVPSAPSSVNMSVITEIGALLDRADAALRAGDFAKYGELQRQARERLKELEQVSGAAR